MASSKTRYLLVDFENHETYLLDNMIELKNLLDTIAVQSCSDEDGTDTADLDVEVYEMASVKAPNQVMLRLHMVSDWIMK